MRASAGSLQPTEHDVVHALCLRSPIARRVELPEAGQREDHVLTTIAFDDDRATGESYCIAHHLFTDDGERKLMVAHLRYHDTFVKLDDAWLFAERKLYVDWTETRSSRP